MNGSEHFDPAALPSWQADRLATLLDALLDALGGTPISGPERASLTWLCGFEADTVANVAAVIRRAGARSTALAHRAEAAVDEARSRHLEADRYRRQLADLCEEERIEAGEDPHAALLAHLRRRREPPLHRARPCPACGTESRAIIDGRCLACREPQRGQS